MAENLNKMIEQAKESYLKGETHPDCVSRAATFEMNTFCKGVAFKNIFWAMELALFSNEDARTLRQMVLNFRFLPTWERIVVLDVMSTIGRIAFVWEKNHKKKRKRMKGSRGGKSQLNFDF